MKNKNGFTMIELLAVLGILVLLTIVIVPNVSSLRKKTLQQTYDNRVNQVKIAAKEWGNDNLISVPPSVSKEYTDQSTCDVDCVCVTIQELIIEGYLAGNKNEKKTLTNPITNKEMNKLLVCVRYDTNNIETRELVSYIVGE